MSWKDILKNRAEDAVFEARSLLHLLFDDPEAWINWDDMWEEDIVISGFFGRQNGELILVKEDNENYEIIYELENRKTRLGSINKDDGVYISDDLLGVMPQLLQDLEKMV
jgi:hypothetical protein